MRFIHIFLLLLPFILLYWVVPWFSNLTIGHDYVHYSIREQVELQFAVQHGDFPLFIPGFACGRTASALTLGQLFHPLPHLAALVPGYFDGAALVINTLLRLISLGIAHLLLFVLLTRLKLEKSIAFILSLITVYNLRMLDLFRYGASLENYTGHLFLSAAMCFYFISPSRVLGPLSMIISTYLLLCGGHPQMMYYGLLGAGIVGLSVPFILPAVSSETAKDKGEILSYYKVVGFSLLCGLMLSMAYIVPFCAEFLFDNAVRVSRGYSWSLSNTDNWGGAVSNFFFPQRSDVHGAFGGSSMIILVIGLPLLFFRKIPIPKIVWVLLFVSLFFFLCSMGDLTPIHYCFWKVFPLADSFRTPGRISMILPMPMALLLAFLFTRTSFCISFRARMYTVSPFFLSALFALILYIGYFGLAGYLPSPARWVPAHIVSRPPQIDTATFIAGLAALALTVLLSFSAHFNKHGRALIGLLLCIAVTVQTGATLRYGTWQKPRQDTYSYARFLKEKKSDIKAPVTSGYGMESALVTKQMSRSILETKLSTFYRDVRAVETDKEAWTFIQESRRGSRAVIVAPLDISGSCSNKKDDRVTLTSSGYNQLFFKVDAKCRGLLTLSFPYSSNWQVFIDDMPDTVYKSNGYELGVLVPKGRHRVEYRYSSLSRFVGLSISALSFTLIGLFFSGIGWMRKKPLVFYLSAAAFVVLGTGIVGLPYSRLYNGKSFGSRYLWTSKELPLKDNLAYAKRTRMSSMQSDENPYFQYSGLAVDGDRKSRGFVTSKNKKGRWEVDLGKIRSLKSVDIYGISGATKLPLIISVSDDRKKFTPIQSITSRSKKEPQRIPVDVTTRHVRIKSKKKGSMSFSEVEIY